MTSSEIYISAPTIAMSVWLLISMKCIVTGLKYTDKGNLECDSRVSAEIAKEEYHTYEFIPSLSGSIQFDTCNSTIDIWLDVYDDPFAIYPFSFDYCADSGQGCGLCIDASAKNSENFTIPQMIGGEQYFVDVTAASNGGKYEVNIKCIATKFEDGRNDTYYYYDTSANGSSFGGTDISEGNDIDSNNAFDRDCATLFDDFLGDNAWTKEVCEAGTDKCNVSEASHFQQGVAADCSDTNGHGCWNILTDKTSIILENNYNKLKRYEVPLGVPFPRHCICCLGGGLCNSINPIAFWNSQLFVVGPGKIHFTDFSLSYDEYSWHEIDLSYVYPEYEIDMNSQRFVQIGSSLWIPGRKPVCDGYTVVWWDQIMRVDLDTRTAEIKDLTLEYYSFGYDWNMVEKEPCMVTDGFYIYILDKYGVNIYNMNIEPYEYGFIYYESENVISCAITSDSKFIYLFEPRRIVKFNIMTETFNMTVNNIPVCDGKAYGKSVTAPNGKIYIQGCQKQTLIFNPETEEFESEIIGINNGNIAPKDLGYYRNAEMLVYDDNVLLFFDVDNFESSLSHGFVSYTVTDLISINFGETMAEMSLFVNDSQIFSIQYYIIDYSENNNIYYVSLHCDISNQINEKIVLNAQEDRCNCDHSAHTRCTDCHQALFDLRDYLKVSDNGIDTLKFYVTSHSDNDIDPLFLPLEFISISLIRCHVTFEQNQVTDEESIVFNYSLSQTCVNASIRSVYTFNIQTAVESIVNVQNKAMITVDETATHITICGLNHIADNCESFFNNTFEITDNAIETSTNFSFSLFFESTMIEFAIDGTNEFSVLTKRGTVELPFEMTPGGIVGTVVGGIAFVAIFALIIYLYYRKRMRLKRLTKGEIKVKNPMVISINIGVYEEYPDNPGIDAYCRELYGMFHDFDNLKLLCEAYKYNMYPKQEKIEWTQKEIITLLENSAKQLSENIETGRKYDGLIVVFSGHGYKNHIITSDYQIISKTAVHRLFSTNFPNTRTIPRAFMFDCCDGNQERSHYPATNAHCVSDQGKNFEIDNIEILEDDDELWKSNQKNPDFLLALVHAANEGFQAKMSSETGSYLISQITTQMRENLLSKQNLYFGEIIDSIQKQLHDDGKQQITATFNNETRYLMFESNDNETEMEEKEEEIEIIYDETKAETNESKQSDDAQSTKGAEETQIVYAGEGTEQQSIEMIEVTNVKEGTNTIDAETNESNQSDDVQSKIEELKKQLQMLQEQQRTKGTEGTQIVCAGDGAEQQSIEMSEVSNGNHVEEETNEKRKSENIIDAMMGNEQ